MNSGRNRRNGLLTAMQVMFICLSTVGLAAAKDVNFTGHYELAAAKSDRSFSVDIKQTSSDAAISFSAAMNDGSGAAPDGTGQGEVDDGVLTFDFKDSFNNEGTCTLELKKDGYHFNMTVLKVVDPSAFHFYGNLLLKRTSTKPHGS